jgi:flagellar assembly factor FliW
MTSIALLFFKGSERQMNLNTSRFGELEIESTDIIEFVHGIPGFEEYKQYVILELEDSPFAYLQSVEKGELAFIVVEPFVFFPQYEFDIPEIALEELRIRSGQEVLIRSIVSAKDKLENATLNLVAPIVINSEQRLGKQVILTNTEYSTRHKVVSKEPDEKGGDGCACAVQEEG